MAATCNRNNPMVRDGTNQKGRFLKSLNPDSFKIDGRSAADLVIFAQRFSQELKFYDRQNQEAGTWFPFFGQNLTAILARCAKLPVESFRLFSQDLRAFLSADPKRSTTQLRHHFQLLFHLPVILLQEMGEIYQALPQNHDLKDYVNKVLIRDVEIPLRELVAYYKGALPGGGKIFTDVALKTNNYNTTFDDQDSRIQLPTVVTERITLSTKLSAFPIGLKFLESIDPGGWAALYTTTVADANPYSASTGNLYSKIFDALTYNLVTKAFDRVLQAMERMSGESAKYLHENLTTFDSHPPHYALWLTFLRLFRFSQDHVNTLTKRHLDYYYKEILQLCLRKGEPNKVHLLFGLNKNVSSHLLSRHNTVLKAGKDDRGHEVSYQLDEDFVVNRATVESLKSMFLPAFQFNTFDYVLPFSAAVTNSKDGNGETLSKDIPQWKPFGPFNKKANARIGFALADKQLFLREGTRVVKVEATLDSELDIASLPFAFTASFTTEDGWFEVSEYSKIQVSVKDKKHLVFEITLHGEDPPVIPYDPSIHQEGFSVSDPVVKIELGFGKTQVSNFFATVLFPLIRDLKFKNVQLSVMAQDVRNITLQNELGVIDTSKPFLPFGPTPAVNSSLILGSSELFSKKLQALALQVEWEPAYNATDYFRHFQPAEYKARFGHLKNGSWERASTGHDVKLFETDDVITIPSLYLDTLSHSIPQTLDNVPYSKTSSTGCVRLELNKDFGHKDYPQAYTVALINLAKTTQPTQSFIMAQHAGQSQALAAPIGSSSSGLPDEPYTPTITGLTITYATQVASPDEFFHLYPFGCKKMGSGNDRLFPNFPHEGELYIGVKNLDPPQRLSMLFQTVDGSANPLKPENKLEWAYLKDNDWVNFKGQEVDDKTHHLTGSGIIGLAVPEDANTAHTLLPSGLYWFRMAVRKNADALNDLLSIDAQAVSATFLPNNNDPQFLSHSLEPGTISKLKVSQGGIKKISQPYAAFGGKPVESSEKFYVRVSERLRHKDRASTMWDYEHLVLEHFPQVYKVKCINHTELCRDLKQNVIADNEVKPGHVLVISIPSVRPGSAMNPLRPYMDKNTMVDIDRFLRARMSPFIQLEVQNPKIEEVQIHCRVAFTDKIADTPFYRDKLRQAIIRYLTPWAYGEGVEISFGGRWHKSAIINFVEEQDYVDFVKDFEMYHKADIAQSETEWAKVDQEAIQATTARSILVSHATHIIEDIKD